MGSYKNRLLASFKFYFISMIRNWEKYLIRGIHFLLYINLSAFAVSCNQNQTIPATETVTDSILPYYSDASFTPRWRNNRDTGYCNHHISSFKVINQLGDTVSEINLKNKIYVAGFFFTACPGICRNLTQQLRKVQDAFLGEDGIQILSFSVTPETDNPDKLKMYANTYGIESKRWWLLTGNRDSIYQMARKEFFADEDMGMQKSSKDFLHTENLLLIDHERCIRGVYKGTSAAEINLLISDIKTLLQK